MSVLIKRIDIEKIICLILICIIFIEGIYIHLTSFGRIWFVAVEWVEENIENRYSIFFFSDII